MAKKKVTIVAISPIARIPYSTMMNRVPMKQITVQARIEEKMMDESKLLLKNLVFILCFFLAAIFEY